MMKMPMIIWLGLMRLISGICRMIWMRFLGLRRRWRGSGVSTRNCWGKLGEGLMGVGLAPRKRCLIKLEKIMQKKIIRSKV